MKPAGLVRPSLPFSDSQIEKVCEFSPALRQYLSRSYEDPLYQQRHLGWAQCLLRTYHEPSQMALACRDWSLVADEILKEVCPRFFKDQDIGVFAFGKLGSHELNLSSDIDLLIVGAQVTDENIRAARKLQSFLSETGPTGFLFRVDYELRPGGKSGPLISSLDQVTDYYGNYGEVWERLAFIRLRPVWGSASVIQDVMKFRDQFSFRRHLDYRLLEDLSSLRTKVQRHAATQAEEGFVDLKLGAGGIRDVELFCHALQVIHGGRLKDLRSDGTTQALSKMQEHAILEANDVEFLTTHYWNLRRAENLVQGKEDRQTHMMPDADVQRFGFNSLISDMQRATTIVDSLLGKVKMQADAFPLEFAEQKRWLADAGFPLAEIEGSWQDVTLIPILSRDRDRDLAARQKFLHLLLMRMVSKPSSPSSKRLSFLQDFLRSIRSKTAFFSLFINRESLVELFAQILDSSPRLSRILISRPELLDSILFQTTEDPTISLEWDEFLGAFSEKKSLTEFLASARFLSDKNLDQLTETMTSLADHVVIAVLEKSGMKAEERQIGVIALGKWGGRELGLSSDLDCIFLTADTASEQDMKRLRRTFNQLGSPQKAGSLYQIDSRLRPADQGGVLVTNLEEFKKFLSERARAWERQAYLKSRVLGAELISAKMICELAVQAGLSEVERLELERIRVELLKTKAGAFDIKYAEGGLLDIELAVQAALLENRSVPENSNLKSMIEVLREMNLEWRHFGNELLKNYVELRLTDQLVRLRTDEAKPNFDKQPHEVRSSIEHNLNASVGILKKLDPRRRSS